MSFDKDTIYVHFFPLINKYTSNCCLVAMDRIASKPEPLLLMFDMLFNIVQMKFKLDHNISNIRCSSPLRRNIEPKFTSTGCLNTYVSN